MLKKKYQKLFTLKNKIWPQKNFRLRFFYLLRHKRHLAFKLVKKFDDKNKKTKTIFVFDRKKKKKVRKIVSVGRKFLGFKSVVRRFFLVMKSLKWTKDRKFFLPRKFPKKRYKFKNNFKDLLKSKQIIKFYYLEDREKRFLSKFLKAKNSERDYKRESLAFFLESQAYVILSKLHIFPSMNSAKNYIRSAGLVLNNNLVHNPYTIVKPGTVVSFLQDHWKIFHKILKIKLIERLQGKYVNNFRQNYALWLIVRSVYSKSNFPYIDKRIFLMEYRILLNICLSLFKQFYFSTTVLNNDTKNKHIWTKLLKLLLSKIRLFNSNTEFFYLRLRASNNLYEHLLKEINNLKFFLSNFNFLIKILLNNLVFNNIIKSIAINSQTKDLSRHYTLMQLWKKNYINYLIEYSNEKNNDFKMDVNFFIKQKDYFSNSLWRDNEFFYIKKPMRKKKNIYSTLRNKINKKENFWPSWQLKILNKKIPLYYKKKLLSMVQTMLKPKIKEDFENKPTLKNDYGFLNAFLDRRTIKNFSEIRDLKLEDYRSKKEILIKKSTLLNKIFTNLKWSTNKNWKPLKGTRWFRNSFLKRVTKWKLKRFRRRKRPLHSIFLKKHQKHVLRGLRKLQTPHWYLPFYLEMDFSTLRMVLLYRPKPKEIFYPLNLNMKPIFSFYQKSGKA